MKAVIILVFCLWALPVEAVVGLLVPAADYYVNQSTGSDSNNGTSASTPFLTIGKLDDVLACGELGAIYGGATAQLKYREQFTGAVCAVTEKQALVGYGAFQPLLDSSDIISAGAFSKTAGRTNIYQADVTFNAVLGFARIWEDTISFARVASLDALDATAARYYIASDPVGSEVTLTLYVHATGGGNPASNGKVYEYNKRGYGVFSQYSMLVSNIHMRRNLANNGSLEVGQRSMLTSLTANDGTKHNILIRQGTVLRHCTMTDSYNNGGAKIALVVNDNTPTGEDVWIESCTHTDALESTGTGYYGHVNSGGAFGTITLKNCNTGTGVASAIAGFSSAAMVVDGGTYTTGGITAGSPTNTLRNVTLVAGQILAPYTSTLTLDGVTATTSSSTGTVRIGTGSAISVVVDIQDSTLLNGTAFSGAVYFSPSVTTSALTLLNNTFLAPVQTNHLLGPGAADLPVASIINGNAYHYPGAASWIVYRGTNYDLSNATHWSNWQALGFDATGSRVTP